MRNSEDFEQLSSLMEMFSIPAAVRPKIVPRIENSKAVVIVINNVIINIGNCRCVEACVRTMCSDLFFIHACRHVC